MTDIFFQTGLSFFEGLALAFSPCILPILPLILAGGATGSRSKPLGIITGFVICFTIFALISRSLFSTFGVDQSVLQTISFGFLILLGLVMLIPALEHGFSSWTQGFANRAQGWGRQSEKAGDGFFGGIILGSLIGVVWTPCAGPLLAAALLQVIQSETSAGAVLMIGAFSLGAAVPMLIIALSSKAMIARVRTLNRHTVILRRAMGAIVVVFASLGFFGFNLGEYVVTRAAAGDSMTITESSNVLKNGLAQPYAAPELTGLGQWFNSQPLKLGDLKGKVVLIDFWTYSCINCIRTLPHIKEWDEKYKDDGLVIIGVHSPEFAFEGKPDNVVKALEKFGISYPVAMDNDFATWKAYSNRYWPSHYLIDKEGKVVYTHFGEGQYDVTEHNIRTLLGITKKAELNTGHDVSSSTQTPETYLGISRRENMAEGIDDLPLHHWALAGNWNDDAEAIQSVTGDSTLKLHFTGKKVFLVMDTVDGKPADVRISLQSGTQGLGHDVSNGVIHVDGSRLYELVNLPQTGEDTVEITALSAGVRAYAFTFESASQ